MFPTSNSTDGLQNAFSQLFHVDFAFIDTSTQGFDLYSHQEDLETVGFFLLFIVDAIGIFQSHLLDILVEVLVLNSQTIDLSPQNMDSSSIVLVFFNLPSKILGLLLAGLDLSKDPIEISGDLRNSE